MNVPPPPHLNDGVEAYKKGDYARALELLAPFAERGDTAAILGLAIMYAKGQGVAQDPVRAAELYRQAAEQGMDSAQFNLGLRYKEGLGVEKDHAEAAKWFRKAADQGHLTAQAHLGMLYSAGSGVTQDHAEALRWLQRPAEHNDAMAQFGLGYMYRHGLGVAADDDEAAKWYRKSADLGFVAAQNNLAGMYRRGQGVMLDFKEAEKWYGLAARGGDKNARFIFETMKGSEKLFPLMREISRADLSVLKGLYNIPDRKPEELSVGATEGSSNHAIWTEMTKLGWMTEGLLEGIPSGVTLAKRMLLFKLTPLGYGKIRHLLKVL